MTKEEFMKKYGDKPFFFDSYYKYKFTFAHSEALNEIKITFGGSHHEIYRFELTDVLYPHTIEHAFDDWSFEIRSEWGDLIEKGN